MLPIERLPLNHAYDNNIDKSTSKDNESTTSYSNQVDRDAKNTEITHSTGNLKRRLEEGSRRRPTKMSVRSIEKQGGLNNEDKTRLEAHSISKDISQTGISVSMDNEDGLSKKIKSVASPSHVSQKLLLPSLRVFPYSNFKKKGRYLSKAIHSDNGPNLPRELWSDIFNRLTYRDLANAERVCRYWKQIAGDDRLWKNHYLSSFKNGDVNSDFYEHRKDWKNLCHMEHRKRRGSFTLSDLETAEPGFLKLRDHSISGVHISGTSIYAVAAIGELYVWNLAAPDVSTVYKIPNAVKTSLLGIRRELIFIADNQDQETIRVFRIEKGMLQTVCSIYDINSPQFVGGCLVGTINNRWGLGIYDFSQPETQHRQIIQRQIKSFKVYNGLICCFHDDNSVSLIPVTPDKNVHWTFNTIFPDGLTDLNLPAGTPAIPDYWSFDKGRLVGAWKDARITAAWDLGTLNKLFQVELRHDENLPEDPGGKITSLDYDGIHCAFGFTNGVFIVLDAVTGNKIAQVNGMILEINGILLEGNRCWTFSRMGAIKSWRLLPVPKEDFYVIGAKAGIENWVDEVKITSKLQTGRWLITGNNAGHIRAWDFYPTS